MRHSALVILVVSIGVVMVCETAQAQHLGYKNQALNSSIVDGTALGLHGSGFLEYARGEPGWTLAGGVAVGQGMLRAGYAEGYVDRFYSLGYARTLTSTRAGAIGSFSSGLDFTLGYNGHRFFGYAQRAARIAIPLTLRVGPPLRNSLALYVAPFGEVGRARLLHAQCETAFTCTAPIGYSDDVTRAAGVGAGAEFTVRRLSLDLQFRDLLARDMMYDRYPTASGVQMQLGLRLRF